MSALFYILAQAAPPADLAFADAVIARIERVGYPTAILVFCMWGVIRLAYFLKPHASRILERIHDALDRHVGLIDQLRQSDARRVDIDERNAKHAEEAALAMHRFTDLAESVDRAHRDQHRQIIDALARRPPPSANGPAVEA